MSIFKTVLPVEPQEPTENAEQKRARRLRELVDELHFVDKRLRELEFQASEPARLRRRRELVLAEFGELKCEVKPCPPK